MNETAPQPTANARSTELFMMHNNTNFHILTPRRCPTTDTSVPPRFTEAWKTRPRHPSAPPEALPPALKRKFDAADANKQKFQRASSMARSPSLAEWDGKAGHARACSERESRAKVARGGGYLHWSDEGEITTRSLTGRVPALAQKATDPLVCF